MLFQKIINQRNPNRLFLIDSVGALLSTILLGFILVRFENIFGMPANALYLLSFIACIFFIYSLLCYLIKIENWRPYLKIIAIANLLYCCLTLGLIIYLYQKLTIFGLLYFVLEIIIVIILSITELKAVSNLTYKKN